MPLPKIPLPLGWRDLVLPALLHVITLARLATLNACNWPDGTKCDGLRLRADNRNTTKLTRPYQTSEPDFLG